MFDEVIAAAERAGAGGVPTRYDKATKSLSGVLDNEDVRHVLVTTKELTHTENSRTITIDAGPGHDVVAMATSRRVLVFVGGQENAGEPDVVIDLADVTGAEYRDSLLSSSVVVESQNQTIEFSPTDGAPDRFVSYVERLGSSWAALDAALDSVRDAMETFERRRTAGADTAAAAETVRSELERAREIPASEYEAPEDVMNAAIDGVAAEFEALQTDSRVQDVEDAIDAAAVTDDDEATCGHLRDACETLAATRSSVDDEDVHAALDGVEADLEERAEAFLADAATAREAARDADPLAAVDRFEEARQRFEAASSVADSVEAFDEANVAERARAVTVELYEALQTEAERLEEVADDGDGDEFERAKSALERAQALADHVPDADPDDLAEDIARLEAAVERSQWEWGKT